MMIGVNTQIPYAQQIDDHTVLTYERDLTRTIKLQGVPFETLGAADINSLTQSWLYSLNNSVRNGKIAFWTHIVRKKIAFDYSNVKYDNDISTEFAKQYHAKISKQDEYINEMYLSPVYRVAPTGLDKLSLRLNKKNPKTMNDVFEDSRDEMDKVSQQLMSALRNYYPKLLGTYEDENDIVCSEIGEFYNYILNHTERKVPLARSSMNDFIQSKNLNFGVEVIELEGNGGSEYAAILSLHAPYEASHINVKCLEGLLSAPFEYTLSQSITIMPFDKADKLLDIRYNNILSTSNNELELANIKEAREKLQAGNFNLMEHEFSLVIYADDIRTLNKNINEATEILDRKALNTSRLKKGVMKVSYFNTMPANFANSRKRVMPIRDSAFAMFFPMHNHPTGNANGSQWGLPIAIMKTMANSPYFFNYHVSRDRLAELGIELDDEDDEVTNNKKAHRKEVGNYKIIGRTGSGKTVVKVALRLLAKKQMANGEKLKTYSFDKDYGEEIAIRAMGGQYFLIDDGRPTDINLFSLPNNPQSYSIIHKIMQWNVEHSGKFTMSAKDIEMLNKAIPRVYDLPEEMRQYARVRDFLTEKGEGSLYRELGQWCDGGKMAWLLDNKNDRFDLSKANDFGFDMTSVMDNDLARTPLLTYLTHKISIYASGTPHIIDIAEAWKSLKDPFMNKYILDKGKTIRKENGIIGLDTQDPDDISKSDIGASLLSQFPTSIIMPNASANEADYVDGLKLSAREFNLIKTTPEGTGQFLVKKGTESVMVRMDLSGMNDMLSVVSSSVDNVHTVREIIEEVGNDPKIWLPIFYQRRK